MPSICIVVPCYNEATRLDLAEFGAFINKHDVRFLFVNDGSTDNTEEVLERLCHTFEQASTLSLTTNQGKAEAVRQGLISAMADNADIVGFMDADLATPLDEGIRLATMLQKNTDFSAVIASRVALSGRAIERHSRRHYTGRVFSTLASWVLRMVIYDTQCGAKFFRREASLKEALSEPFCSRWAFDVELIGRLVTGSATVAGVPPHSIVEEPLMKWTDVAGSKLNLWDMIRTTLELWNIEQDLSARRQNRTST